jgi:uncharacterized protein DUF4185
MPVTPTTQTPVNACQLRCRLLPAVMLVACGAPGTDSGPDSDGSPMPPRPTPVLGTSEQLCKLLNNKNVSDPTPNGVQFHANVLGADLGIPVVANERLYLLFGDTIGFAGIWGGGESHPDSIGYALDPPYAIAANPALLCTHLAIITLLPKDSRGPTVDPRVEADFAGAAMIAPPGHQLGEFIHNAAGSGATRFPQLPGDFEVPSGAFADNGSLYVFYTTVRSQNDVTMIGGYLARWNSPSTTGVPAYQILYAIDDPSFINIAAVAHDDYVYMFGTGAYRTSSVTLARKRLDALATPGLDRVDTIIATPAFGETSVRYFAAIDRWMFLAEESLPASNRIIARFADRPEGPWSDAIVIHDMADPEFRVKYCCASADQCTGVQFMNCNRTGFYGSYLLPDVETSNGTFTVSYTMSSFDPYNVALFRTTFTVAL